MANSDSRQSYGWEIGPSDFGPRGIVARPETSASGNLVLRVGTETADGQSWQGAAHVVLTPNEADSFLAACHRVLRPTPVDRAGATPRSEPLGQAHDEAQETRQPLQWRFDVQVTVDDSAMPLETLALCIRDALRLHLADHTGTGTTIDRVRSTLG